MSIAMSPNRVENRADIIGVRGADEAHVLEQMERYVAPDLQHFSNVTESGVERWADLPGGYRIRVDVTESAMPGIEAMATANEGTVYHADLEFVREKVKAVDGRVVATYRVEAR